jgi:hypothetical protein
MSHISLQQVIEVTLRELGYEVVGDDDEGWSFTFGSFESAHRSGSVDTIEEATRDALRDAIDGLQVLLAAGVSVVEGWEEPDLAEAVRELDAALRSMRPPRGAGVPGPDRAHAARVQAVNRFAQFEGWAIFNDREIQRDDEMDRFASDDDAAAHVRHLACEGSRLHREALSLVRGYRRMAHRKA